MPVRDKPRQARQTGSRRLRLLVLSLAVLIAISLLSRLPAWSLLELRSFDYLSTVDDPVRHPAALSSLRSMSLRLPISMHNGLGRAACMPSL